MCVYVLLKNFITAFTGQPTCDSSASRSLITLVAVWSAANRAEEKQPAVLPTSPHRSPQPRHSAHSLSPINRRLQLHSNGNGWTFKVDAGSGKVQCTLSVPIFSS